MMNKNDKKLPFEKEINGRKMRYCGIYNIWVNREGTYVYREYKDPAWNHALQIHTRLDGSKYLDTKSHGEIPLDEAVAICFSPMPRDGRKYIPVHKDNDPGNCHALNLAWKQVLKYSPTDKERKLDNGLVVRSDGTILDKRKKLFVVTVIGDSDTDRLVSVDPYVCYYRKNRYGSIDERRARVDALMAEAEFVAGDNSLMSRPLVLHKDQDYLNYNSSNLEWAEEDSPEYQAYMWQKKEDLDRLTIQENPNHPNPLMKPLH